MSQPVPLKRVDLEFDLADGAAWDGRGRLYVPDFKAGTLTVVRPNRAGLPSQVRLRGDWAISGTFYQNGLLHLVDNQRRQLLTLTDGNKPVVVATFGDGQRPNDLVVDRSGNAYVTFTGDGVVRRVSPEGAVSVVVQGLESPNGIAIAPDESRLYVSCVRSGEIWVASIGPEGTVGDARRFAQLPKTEDGYRGDGMTVDRAGQVYCAAAKAVVVFDQDGNAVDQIETPQRPINVVFAGDGRELFISTFGGLYHTTRGAYGVQPWSAETYPDLNWDRDVVYHDADGRRLLMDVMAVPSDPKPRPAVLLVHGGGWLRGDKKKFTRLAAALAHRGYVVANIEYRLGHEAKFPAGIRDCNAATAYLRAHGGRWNVDPARIAAVGGSAGGHLVGLMAAGDSVPWLRHSAKGATVSSELQAAVVMAGPLEMLTGSVAERSRQASTKSNAWHWMGGTIGEQLPRYELSDALTKIDKTMPPTLFICGSLDHPERNEPARQVIKQFGGVTELVVHDGAKHGYWNLPAWQPRVVDAIDGFLKEHL